MKYLIFLFLIALSATSCMSNKKLAQRCAEAFPVRDSFVMNERVVTDTIILPESFVEYIDTTVCPPADTPAVIIKPVIVKVPAKSVSVEYVVKDSIVYRRDMAAETQFKEDLNACKTDLETYRTKAEKSAKWFWWWLVTALMLVGSIVFRFIGK